MAILPSEESGEDAEKDVTSVLRFFGCGAHLRDLKEFDPERVRRILVVSSTGIGDALLSTPAIHALRQRYPTASIVAFLRHKYVGLFDTNPDIDGVIPYYGKYKKLLRTLWALRRGRFDLAVIFHGDDPDIIPLIWCAGVPYIVRIPNDTTRYRTLLSNADLSPDNARRPGEHGIEMRLRTAALVGATTSDRRMVLPVTDEDRYSVGEYLRTQGVEPEEGVIGLQVGTSTPSRRWLSERFAALGTQLMHNSPSLWIVLTGSREEQDLCERVAEQIEPRSRVCVVAGDLPLRQVAALVERMALLVTADTGIMHMAVAVGTPTVSLFAMANYMISGPYPPEQKHVVIQKWRTCVPCIGKACPYAICMENISVSEVLEAVQRQLSVPQADRVEIPV